MKGGKQDVNAYIAAAPKKAQPMLRQLRRIIKACAPKATERISYKMPYYEYHGRLVYFAAYPNHVSLHIGGSAMKMFAKDLKAYKTSTATVQFPIGSVVPASLVRKLVRARIQGNIEAKRR